jgi:hypothetical protein
MKELSLLTWLTQLGLSVAMPLAGFVFLALWLRSQFGWGDWVIWVGALLGLLSAWNGLCTTLKLLNQMTRKNKEEKEPPVSFNDHD